MENTCAIYMTEPLSNVGTKMVECFHCPKKMHKKGGQALLKKKNARKFEHIVVLTILSFSMFKH